MNSQQLQDTLDQAIEKADNKNAQITSAPQAFSTPSNTQQLSNILDTAIGGGTNPTNVISNQQDLSNFLDTSITNYVAPTQTQAYQPQQSQPQGIRETIQSAINYLQQGLQNIGQKIQPAAQFVEENINKKLPEPLPVIAVKKTAEFVKDRINEYVQRGAALTGIVDKGLLLPSEVKLLKDNNYLDENGNVKIGKTAVETAKTVADLAVFFPQLFVPAEILSKTAVGENVINILGREIPVAKVVEGQLISGTFFTLNTPDLESIFKDPKILGEAAKNFFKGQGLGGLISIAISAITAPDTVGFKALSKAEQEEVQVLKIKLARKYHPNSMLETGTDKNWVTIESNIENGNIDWLRKLDSATPEEASKLLNTKLPEVTKVTGQLPEKTGVSTQEKGIQTQLPEKSATQGTTEQITTIAPAEAQKGVSVSKPAVDNVLNYISDSGNRANVLTPETINELKQKPIGVNDLNFDKNGNITLYREGEIDPGKPTSMSIKQTQGQKPVVVNKDEILANTTSPDLLDYVANNYKDDGGQFDRTRQLDKLEQFNKTESEVIVLPKETPVEKPQTASKMLKPTGTGETKASTLAVKIEAKAIEQKLTEGFKDLPTYETLNIKDQALKAAQLVTDDYEKAIDIALGRKNPPRGVIPESVYVAVENKAIKEGSVDLLRQLATSPRTSEATAMGQRIRYLAERNTNSPVNAIREIADVRKKAIEEKYKMPATEAVKKEVNKIKASIKKPSKQDWKSFVDSIEC